MFYKIALLKDYSFYFKSVEKAECEFPRESYVWFVKDNKKEVIKEAKKYLLEERLTYLNKVSDIEYTIGKLNRILNSK